MAEPVQDTIRFWLKETRKQLRLLVPPEQSTLRWTICLYRAAAAGDGPHLDPSDHGDRPGQLDQEVAEEAARLHTQVLGNRGDLGGRPGSILAVPVFDARVFQPSPVLRPVRAVVSFACDLPVAAVGDNQSLRILAEQYAGLLTKPIIRETPNEGKP